MQKVLVIVTHPNIKYSSANKKLVAELNKHPDRFTVHELYTNYPDFQIDVAKEQALLEQYQTIVLQFPIYWFSCPPLLKKWLDDVFTYGWAYGGTQKLRGKTIGLAVTAGASEESYQQDKYSLATLLTPFKATINYVGAKAANIFPIYGTMTISHHCLAEKTKAYINYLDAL